MIYITILVEKHQKIAMTQAFEKQVPSQTTAAFPV